MNARERGSEMLLERLDIFWVGRSKHRDLAISLVWISRIPAGVSMS
jgi:hypothetical protein